MNRMKIVLLVGCALSLSSVLMTGRGGADAAVPSFKIENGELKTGAEVVFETGSDKLKPESDKALEVVKQYLAAKSYISLLRIEVHTDAQGKGEANQSLSEKRALAVARALVKSGVDCKRIIPVGFGDTKPLATNATAEGRAQNRRVQFMNAALRGRAIGGMPADGGGKVAGDPCH